MVNVVVILFALLIALRDMREHQIRNIHLLAFALPLSFDLHQISLIQAFILILLVFATCLIFKIGGGDFKLFSLLVLMQGTLVVTTQYFLYFLIANSLLIGISLLRHRNLTRSVPLAPAILAPFLLVYLGI